MSLSTLHVRSLLTVALVAAMTVCCCSGRLAARMLAFADGGERIASTSQGGSGHGCCGASEPDQPQPGNERAPCDCEQHREAKQIPETGAANSGLVQAVAFDVAQFWRLAPFLTPPSRPLSPLGGQTPRPPSSLLRQHCALTI